MTTSGNWSTEEMHGAILCDEKAYREERDMDMNINIMETNISSVRFGTKTIGGCTPEDVMQALLAALEFGDDAGYAALYSAERDAGPAPMGAR